MSHSYPSLTSLRKVIPSVFFMLVIASILIGSNTTGSFAGEAPIETAEPITPPKAIIKPKVSSYPFSESPEFDIETGSNTYFKVELALAKRLFDSGFGNRITSGSSENQNFYSSGYKSCAGGDIPDKISATSSSASESCKTTFSIPSSTWSNLRGSLVYYRVITASDSTGSDMRVSISDSNWSSAPSVNRTGESWYGLPHHDRTSIGGTPVVVNGKLNGKALSSDYGPRNVTGGTRFHPGLDIPVSKGTPVYAIVAGTVVSVPSSGDSMHRLDINHGQYRSGYVHLDKTLVSLNDTVVAGQLIGYSGDWFLGKPDNIADHLHFDAGYTTSQIYHNIMDYVRYTDNHVISGGSGTYLGDSYTHNKAIDVVPAAGDQDLVLIAFGVTTDYDKDLHLVEVQVGSSLQDGQYFFLDYNNVKTQNSSTGVITLNNGKTFRVRPLSDDVYGDANLGYAFYVKPATTNINVVAKDYFFFPWDVSAIENQEAGGPRTIQVRLGEEDNEDVSRSVTVGPALTAIGSTATQIEMSLDLVVTNYDIPEITSGSINLSVGGLPEGWSASFSEQNPTIQVGQSRTVTLTLTANPPYSINADTMRDNNTRVVATFGRIEALKDNYVICPADISNVNSITATSQASSATSEFCPTGTPQATILQPSEGSKVPVGKSYDVQAFAAGADGFASASLVVQNLSDNSTETITTFSRSGDTFTIKWTPQERDVTYGLIASVSGFEDSDARRVTAVNDDVIFIQPLDGRISGGAEVIVIIDAPEGATRVVLDIDPLSEGSGGDMTKVVDGTWKFFGWIPSKDEDYYNLTAIAHLPDGSRPYAIVRVEPIPDDPTIEVPPSVQLGETVDVIVTAPRAFSVSLLAGGGINELGQEGDLWKFRWTPDALGEFTVWAVASYSAHADKTTEHIKVQVVDDGSNAIVVNITAPTSGAEIEKGSSTTVWVESPGEMTKVELEITDPAGNQIVKTVTVDDVGRPFASVGIPWKPSRPGAHTLKASGWNAAGQKGWTDPSVQVTVYEPDPIDPPDPSEQGTWIWINEWSFLWKNNKVIKGLHDNHYVGPHFYNTLIPHEEFVCGVIGVAGKGGDIGEKTEVDPMDAYLTTLYTDETNSWQLMIDFNSLHKDLLGNVSERDEHWDVQLICFDRKVASEGGPEPDKPVFTKELYWYASSVHESTGYQVDQYACGIVGYNSTAGDIDEHDAGDIFRNDLYDNNGVWWLRADFRTQGPHESWQHQILCVDRDWAAMSTPEPGKPFVFTSYGNMGDNITKLTEFSTYEWTCGVVGFSALNGDIDEGEKGDGDNLLLAYMYEDYSLGKWRIRADFRTHKDSETWNADVMCVAKEFNVAPIMTKATPELFTGVYDQPSGSKYGTGMHLEWTETRHPDAAYYEIRYTEDGGRTWQTYNSRRPISHGGWINHHGSLDCGHNFKLCLKRKQSYHYQVRVLDAGGQELTGWSDMIGMSAPDWPANVEMTEPSPPGPYRSGNTVTIYLKNTYGPDLDMTWKITNYNSASHVIIAGCEDGSVSNWESRYCELEIFNGSSGASASGSVGKLAALAPETSIHVEVIGTDSWGYSDSVFEVLEFERVDPFATQSFDDVPPEHWAHTYVENLSDQGITSGCTTDGNPSFCPNDPLLRSQMAVFTVRSQHLDEPGYVPPAPEKVIFVDEEVQTLASVASTNTEKAYRQELYWYDKYAQDLYDKGIISGCSTDPAKFCPNDATTRAQMTVFVVRMLHGENFKPSEPAHQLFNDAPLFDGSGNRVWSTKWIAQATVDGLIQACGTDMGNKLFRPDAPVTRAEAACMMHYALNGSNR